MNDQHHNEDPSQFQVDRTTKTDHRSLDDEVGRAEAHRRRAERAIRHHIKTIVRRARNAAELSQVDAATAWGASQPQVSRLERDPGNAHMATVLSYLNALGAQVEIRVRTGDQRDIVIVLDDTVDAQLADHIPMTANRTR